MYRCLLFDLDGTLADTDLLVVEGYLPFFRRYRPQEKIPFRLLASFSGPSLKETMESQFPHQDSEALIQEFKKSSYHLYDTFAEVYDGVLDGLRRLKEAGLKLGIITSKMKAATEHTLTLLQMDRFFDVIITYDDVRKPKPDPEGIFQALSLLKMAKADTLYVGDGRADYEAARAAGVDIAMVSYNIRGRFHDLHPRYYVDHFDQLTEVILHEK